MTKRELIDEITHLNPSAPPAFLAEFEPEDLAEYLRRLRDVQIPPAQRPAPAPPDQAHAPAPSADSEKKPEPALF
ncbi:MAG: hypothetical protein B1H04_01370 [Planctomycetales bacterium 4484_123]|nr:MAG: hypothetical protein B1H04_01370 [Planctomycetales bacterium 4484_123]